jgi:hypothetical protein
MSNAIIHLWWEEIDDARGVMRCGFTIYFDDEARIVNDDHDFVMPPHVGAVTCRECRQSLKAQEDEVAAARRHRELA